MPEPRGLQKLFERRIFWIVLSVVLLAMVGRSWQRHETAYVVIYLLFLAFTIARASGWRMKPM